MTTVRTHAATVTLAGEIDLATAPGVRQALMAALDSRDSLTVNMAAVRFIDATGIGVLIAAANRARDRGGTLILQAPSQPVRRIIGILRLADRLPVDARPSDRARTYTAHPARMRGAALSVPR